MLSLQNADLYAHTCPVKFIHDSKLLGSSDSFNDALGAKNIWARIKKAGQDMFYRVEYKSENNLDELSDPRKREQEKTYVEGDGKKQLIDTSIADTPYIQNVIKAYVNGDKTAEKQLYKEPGDT